MATETQRQRCIDYLLGEMPEQDNRQFEAELASDRELNELLLQQAELIAAVGTSVPVEAVAASSTENRWSRISIAALLALGACLLVSIASPLWNGNGHSTDMSLESVQIANAWAENQHASIADSVIANDSGENDFVVPDELNLNDRSPASWILDAVAADIELSVFEEDEVIGDG